jgi:hypothetical protein
MLYILKISLVTYIFKLNSLKSATKAINLASFKEIQWQIILNYYLKSAKLALKIYFFCPGRIVDSLIC